MLIGKITKHIGIDRIVAKRRVLLQTDPSEPTVDVQSSGSGKSGRRGLAPRNAAALRLVGIKPTTIDGAIALLNYFADIGADDVPPISDRAAEKLGAPFAPAK
jgi:hypothetical protein